MSESVAPGWAVEVIPRHSKELLIFSKDGETRGTIEVFTAEEKDRWMRAIGELDRPLSPRTTSERLINALSPQGSAPTTSGPSSNPSIPNSPTGT